MVPAGSDGISLVPPYSGYRPPQQLADKGLSPSMATLPSMFSFTVPGLCLSYNPCRTLIRKVWAVPISLATTLGITIVFSSSCYLDVSVHRVRLRCRIPGLLPGGLPHSDIHGSFRCVRIPVAFRSLPRPSSPLRAKASPVCSYLPSPMTLSHRFKFSISCIKPVCQRTFARIDIQAMRRNFPPSVSSCGD